MQHWCLILLVIAAAATVRQSSWSVEGATSAGNDDQACAAANDQEESTTAASGGGGVARQAFVIDHDACVDQDEECTGWAETGECIANPRYMNVYCRRSCNLCGDQREEDKNPKVIEQQQRLGNDMGVAQLLEHAGYKRIGKVASARALEESREYLSNTMVPKELKALCKNEDELCTIWALSGECEKNPSYMKRSCASACQSCEWLSVEGRCPIDPNATAVWDAGELDAMFTKLTSEPYLSEYNVSILSSPSMNSGPWVITMEGVVTVEEAQRLIELGGVEGYERSSDVGRMKADGTHSTNVNSGRTSTNAWCLNACYKDPVALRVAHRLSNITGIPEVNSEYLQLLRYEKGQHYQVHHDYIEFHEKRQSGVRILTMYLYLNDEGIQGGGTNFDQLNITVLPRRGRALLWPSVLDSNPAAKDGRTTHQAMPVEDGVKFGANAWFHLYDFKTPHSESCV